MIRKILFMLGLAFLSGCATHTKISSAKLFPLEMLSKSEAEGPLYVRVRGLPVSSSPYNDDQLFPYYKLVFTSSYPLEKHDSDITMWAYSCAHRDKVREIHDKAAKGGALIDYKSRNYEMYGNVVGQIDETTYLGYFRENKFSKNLADNVSLCAELIAGNYLYGGLLRSNEFHISYDPEVYKTDRTAKSSR